MAAGGNVKNVKVGPGRLWIGAVGVAEPANAVTAKKFSTSEIEAIAGLVPVGYTEEGSTFSISPGVENIEVAEEKTPIAHYMSTLEYTLEFAFAEMTARNLKVALNGGTITTASGLITFDPPSANDEPVRSCFFWESDDRTERMIWRQAYQSGDVAIARQKGPDKATIPASFMLEVPDAELPWNYYAVDDEFVSP